MRPGVYVTNRSAPPARGAPTDTSQFFVAGLADRGPTDHAVKVESLADFTNRFGARQSYSPLYDALDLFFREGGSTAFVARVVGPAAVTASATLSDGTAGTLKVSAKSPGAWGNTLTVQVTAGTVGGTYRLVITDNTGFLESSPDLADKAAALAWSATATYVTVTSLASPGNPAVAAATGLTGGADDRASIVTAQKTAALALFVNTLGPGQIAYPGDTTSATQAAVVAQAAATNRVALLDGQDTASAANLTSQATTIEALVDRERAGLFAPWVVLPGLVAGTTRVAPPCGLIAGLIARADATGNPNRAAAGGDFPVQYGLAPSQTYSDADQDTLADAGINVNKIVWGTYENYGFRSLADKAASDFWQLNAARTRMYIVAQAQELGEQFVFSQVDGRGHTLSAFAGVLSGMLMDLYNADALFGETTSDAFQVSTVGNTPDTLSNGELHATIAVRVSPFAERVLIDIVKVPITQTL